ncbi:hypothetical protein E5288_WYG014114 [Bos mutus]|uniref:Uncharacterized protein n=1 Tax=Bos mutus TaxID=72004 RepID=A0A6B0RZA0_9CETA|nr:hypothetical protein [Bos mutus]
MVLRQMDSGSDRDLWTHDQLLVLELLALFHSISSSLIPLIYGRISGVCLLNAPHDPLIEAGEQNVINASLDHDVKPGQSDVTWYKNSMILQREYIMIMAKVCP